MLNPFERLRFPPKIEEFISIVLIRIPKVQGNNGRDRQNRQRKIILDMISKYEHFINSLPDYDSLHQFYRGLLDIEDPLYKEEVRSAKFVIRKAKEIIREESEESISRVGGRVFSLLRKKGKSIDILIDVSRRMSRLSSIDPRRFTVIVAGPPNVGKSTMVTKLSSARLEIASYPFTTKQIHVGHVKLDLETLQIVDTPGILDRPDAERNEIEKRAINALETLSGIILVMLDVSEEAYYTAEEQVKILKRIQDIGKPTRVVLNKIDKVSQEFYQEVTSRLREIGEDWYEVSLTNGEGLDLVRDYIISQYRRWAERGRGDLMTEGD